MGGREINKILRHPGEFGMWLVFLLAACASIIAVILICVFMFGNGVPAMSRIGFLDFLTGTKWKPLNDIYGILPMIVGSIYVTAGAVIVGVPVGLLCAAYMARFCPPGLHRVLKPAIDLLARHPVHRLRLLRPGGHRAADAGPFSGNQRQRGADGVCHAGHHDFADHHQRV